tara:strand:- start:1423 stop:2082 length:660 start_codon:yes stop_codon:yes gene_type:complete
VNISHHPDQTLLLDYATGAMSDAFSLIIATHLAMCPACRREVSALERIGGAMLDRENPPQARGDDFEALMARIERDEREPEVRPARPPVPPALATFPRPLRDRLTSLGSDVPWNRRGAIETAFLPAAEPGHKIRMLRIAPGHGVPQHSHRGTELTLVLEGGFSDITGNYVRGDIQVADQELDHQPLADDQVACICLAVTSDRLRLTGPLGRIIDPLLRV